ncbi:MAG: N-acetyltransferase family protein [Pseudomonadota bacterium]
MKLIECTEEKHAASIIDIFNHAIVNSTALFDYKPRSIESMKPWFEVKRKNNFPVIGIEDGGNNLLGFVSYGTFRGWPAYKYSVEHSVYVHHEYRKKGIGDLLLASIVEKAIEQNYHLLIGGIEATNLASIKLHQKHGFTHSGTITQAGYKFGRWLDVAFYQLILRTPNAPIDG